MAHQFLDNDDWQDILQDLLLPGHKVRSGHLDSTDIYFGEAVEDITEGMAIALMDGADVTIRRATSADGRVSGVATISARVGDQVTYATRGFVFVENWEPITGSVRLVAGGTYFLHLDGQLSSSPPLSGYHVAVGQAQSWHVLDASIQTPIKL